MKKIVILGLAFVFTMALMGQEARAGRVGKRQCRQSSRIARGVKSGQLTRGETRALACEQRRIQRTKARAWSDGRLTRRERVHLEMMQCRASRHIYRLKHNDNTR